jgi:tetratricopeptide (TPR) repeat protein
MSASPSRTVVPDGSEVRSRREEAGLSQGELAKKTGYSERAIKAIEAGMPCFKKTLSDISSALQCKFDDLVLDIRRPSMATVDEALASIGPDGRELCEPFRRLLYSLDRAPLPQVAEMELLLLLAIRRDVLGEAGATLLAEAVVMQAPKGHGDLPGRATVRLASFYDHAGQQSKGIRLLDQFLKQHAKRDGLYWWALLQKGTLLVSAAEWVQASAVLRRVRTKAPDKRHRLGAMHQLGVISLERGRLRQAESWFSRCLEERKQAAPDFRIAYDYRRLAEVYSKSGQLDDARSALAQARAVVKAFSFRRYQKKLRSQRFVRSSRKP